MPHEPEISLSLVRWLRSLQFYRPTRLASLSGLIGLGAAVIFSPTYGLAFGTIDRCLSEGCSDWSAHRAFDVFGVVTIAQLLFYGWVWWVTRPLDHHPGHFD